MKRNPGNFTFFQILFLVLPLLLFAKEDFKYELQVNKHTVFVNEPILLTFKVWSKVSKKKLIFFEFTPIENRLVYVSKMLKEDVIKDQDMQINSFKYLIFPKKAGNLSLDFDFWIKTISKERLTESNMGDFMRTKAIETIDKKIELKPLNLDIKPLPKKVSFVGDYELKVSLDRNQTEVQSPVYLTLILKGVGSLPKNINLKPDIEDVRVFDDEPKVSIHYDKDGVHYEGKFSYALLSEKDFKIPAIEIEGFSYTKNRIYQLKSSPFSISVKPVNLKSLIDERDNPKSIYESFSNIREWLVYILIFASGYISAILVSSIGKFRIKREDGNSFKKDVKSAKDAKTLLKLLLREDSLRYRVWIEKLESEVYQGERLNLREIKKEILKTLT